MGPFDGRVGAHFAGWGAPFFITSHATYIPDFAPGLADQLFLRRDMRYGPDDPTLWPQQYSAYFCHLGAIPRRPSGPTDDPLMWMWWDPQPVDFVSPQSGLTITRGLGQLRPEKTHQLGKLVDKLLDECKAYTASIAPAQVNPLLPQITQAVRLAIERLRSIPSTYDRMVLGVTSLQRAYLELTGLLRYISIYKPRMENLDVEAGPPDDCIGVFTADPAIAQLFRIARLPYWLIRPLSVFNKETILSVVPLLDPTALLVLEAAPGYPTVPVGTDLDQRIRSLHLCTQSVPWYKNPFASPVATSVQPPQQAVAGPSRPVQQSIRPNPCKPSKFSEFLLLITSRQRCPRKGQGRQSRPRPQPRRPGGTQQIQNL